MTDASHKKLNSEQLAAIEHGEGPLLIIAGAGTGKTTVVTERIKFLITQRSISPNNILALTFTEKAAREMEERVDIALPLSYGDLWISTFHSFCDRILRDEAINIGLDSRYRLMTQAENIAFLRKQLFKFDLDYFRPLGNPYKFIEGLLQHFSRLKDEDVSPEEYLQHVESLEEDPEEKTKYLELANAYKNYEELKVKDSLLDFGDLLSWTLKLFRTRKNILKTYQEKFKYVLVDEFQDTNFAQYVLVKLLAPPPKFNLTVVGDDNQAIYRFRGAAISNILQFKDDYRGAKEVILNKNYRSTQTILDSAYKLIKNNDPDTLEAKLGICKKLKKMRKVEEVPVEFLMAERIDQEAEMVVGRIKQLIDYRLQTTANEKAVDSSQKSVDGYTYKDFAILVRANNHAEPFIKALNWAGIPNQFLGPGMLFRQPEVKDLIAYLQILSNFEDNIALYRLLSMAIFNISGRDLAELINYSRRQHLSLFETCEYFAQEKKEFLSKIVELIHRHLSLAKTETAPKILYDFLQETGLWQKLANVKTTEEERETQNITKFLEKLTSFEAEHEDASVQAVVDYLNLCLELGESPLANDTDWTENDAVTILTVHSAKGLEFPVVFLVNLVAQRFPTTERHEQIPIPEELVKELLPIGDYHLEEERRLFYVGMTRAKDKLYLTAAKFYGEGKREKKISPFVKEALGEKIKNTEVKIQSKQPPKPDFNNVTLKQLKQSISLSYSQIETFRTCPLKYKYRYVLDIPTPPGAAISFGNTIHETMRDFYQRAIAGQNPTKEDILKILDENWVSTGYSSKEQRERYKKEGQRILAGFYQNAYDPKILPVALEQSFSIKFNPKLKFVGKIDRIDQDKEIVEIIDYKTGKAATKKEADKDLQLSLYALATISGQLTSLGILANTPRPEEVKLSFYFFDDQVKVSSVRTEADLEKVREEILSLAEEVSQSDFAPNPGLMCDFCEYRMLCDAWK